jgi:hypothetical protein
MDSHPIGAIGSVEPGASGVARFDVLRAFSAKTSAQALALQIQIVEPGAKARNQIALVEASDVPALMAALSAMSRAVEARQRGEVAPDGAPSHRFGSLGIGLASGSEDRAYLAAGDRDPARLTLGLDDLIRVEALVKRAAEKMRELERSLEKG